MCRRIVLCLFLSVWSGTALASDPHILSFDANGHLAWSNAAPALLARIDRSTNLADPVWVPHFYAPQANAIQSTVLPSLAGPQAFYRLNIMQSIPDPNLLVHLSFDNAFETEGVVLDISGHGNHGYRYGRPASPASNSNWPSYIKGPGGDQAGEFSWGYDGWGNYGKSGDYVGIRRTDGLAHLPEATISIWVHYYSSLQSNYIYDHASTPLSAGYIVDGAWTLGRYYAPYTSFRVVTSNNTATGSLAFPDSSATGNTGGWHHYLVTFSNGWMTAYYDGLALPSGPQWAGVSTLTMGGWYIGIGCWTFNASPWMDLAIDQHPNNAWMNGAMDDLRIYRRALTPPEIWNLYRSRDTEPPSVPAWDAVGVYAEDAVELRWLPATDNRIVAGYRLFRDGVPIAETLNLRWRDSGRTPGATHSYTLVAFDNVGNVSATNAQRVATLPSPGQSVEVIVDDSASAPAVEYTGDWTFSAAAAGYYGSGYRHDNNAEKGARTCSFRPTLTSPGHYAVYLWYTSHANRADNVPVRIQFDGGEQVVAVNQRREGSQWRLLGVFPFASGSEGSVTLLNAGTDGYVIADAIRLIK